MLGGEESAVGHPRLWTAARRWRGQRPDTAKTRRVGVESDSGESSRLRRRETTAGGTRRMGGGDMYCLGWLRRLWLWPCRLGRSGELSGLGRRKDLPLANQPSAIDKAQNQDREVTAHETEKLFSPTGEDHRQAAGWARPPEGNTIIGNNTSCWRRILSS